ncbi:MAG TPA: protein kinase family protein [Chthoniobacterales bacterium]|jgi:serine/threonine protein kinase
MEVVPSSAEPPVPTEAPAASEPRIEVGSKIFGRFTLVSELGHGRSSTTWLAEDPRFRSDIALKLFRSSTGGSDEERQAWREFLRRLRTLNHPDIALTIEFFHQGSWLALSNRYEEGPTLAASTLQAGKKLPAPRVQEVLQTVGLAVAAANDQRQLVHGNLNTWNILLPTGRTSAKVCDFGFYPPLPPPGEETENLELGWKLACLSPERLQGGAPSHADDIYAFGAVAFQLFTGKNPPLQSSGALDSDAAATLLTDAQADWRQQILLALSPQPTDRPKALSALLGSLGIQQTHVPGPQEEEEPSGFFARKNNDRPSQSPGNERPISAILMPIAIVLAIIGIGFFVAWTVKENRREERVLEERRFEEEKRERMLEEQERARFAELNARLGSSAPSSASMESSRRTMGETAPTPTPKPRVLNSNAVDIYRDGQQRFAAGDSQGALMNYEMAELLQPDWPDLLEARGNALLALNRAQEAFTEFSRALVLEPERVTSLIGRARAHLASNDKAAATTDLQTVLKLDPANAAAAELLSKL